MNKMLIVLVSLLFFNSVYADTLHMKNGRVIRNIQITVNQNSDFVSFYLYGTQVKFPKSTIDKIEWSELENEVHFKSKISTTAKVETKKKYNKENYSTKDRVRDGYTIRKPWDNENRMRLNRSATLYW